MAGIYIHIPFCKQRCTYCDFHFSTTYAAYRVEMIESLCTEIALAKGDVDFEKINELDTIYFGGGTPSLLRPDELDKIVHAIRSNFNVNSTIEFTLEANPDDINPTQIAAWREIGINRLSIGIQSFRAEDLKWMNRAHSVEEALHCIEIAQEGGISNLSVDLIYGLPHLTQHEWLAHVQRVVDMGVQHLSAYCLTVEHKTALHNLVEKQQIIPSSEDEQHDQFMAMLACLTSNGFEQYEISNFCRPGYRAVHNSNYWKQTPYIGIGPSAHSFNGEKRRWNSANNQLYMRQIGERTCWYEEEVLTDSAKWNETILTGLRTVEGVALSTLDPLGVLTNEHLSAIDEFRNQGWMIQENDRLVLTKEGRLMADHIASVLFR